MGAKIKSTAAPNIYQARGTKEGRHHFWAVIASSSYMQSCLPICFLRFQVRLLSK